MEHEWSVAATDLILASTCSVLAWLCVPRRGARTLALAGAAALLGTIRHGWGPQLSHTVYRIIWWGSYGLIAIAGTILLKTVLRYAIRPGERQDRFCLMADIKICLSILLFALGGDPVWVAVSWGTDLVLIGLLGIRMRRHWWLKPAARWLIIGSCVSVLAGAIQLGLFVGTTGTLHNDLFHLIQTVGMYAYYRAIVLLRSWPRSTPPRNRRRLFLTFYEN